MKRSFFALLVISFLSISTNCLGAKGCKVGNAIYTFPTGDNYLLFGFIDTGWEIYTNPLTLDPQSCPRAVQGTSLGTICYSGAVGTEYNYTVLSPGVGCPIDDYVPIIFIFTAGIAVLRWRKGYATR